MMQPEDKIQEIAERAERLQEIGSSILRAARDELCSQRIEQGKWQRLRKQRKRQKQQSVCR